MRTTEEPTFSPFGPGSPGVPGNPGGPSGPCVEETKGKVYTNGSQTMVHAPLVVLVLYTQIFSSASCGSTLLSLSVN